MKAIWAALALLAAATPAATAQDDDPMEAQRCIWRCGDATGMKQPAYDRCIARSCDVGEKPKPRRKPRDMQQR